MRSLKAFKSSALGEINQKETLQKILVLKVLSSKRLLVDHVEVIEESLHDLMKTEAPTEELFTLLKTSSVLAASFVLFIHLKQKYLIPSLGGVMPILYIQKLVNVKDRKSMVGKLAKFISSLDSYESAVKKNKTFLHEAQIIKSTANVLKRYDKDNRIPHRLIESMKRVINALYGFVKDLEGVEIAEKLEVLYEPFEDLQDCELMSVDLEFEVDVKVIKDFFNIFAYVQSQVLLRFALIAVSNVEDSKKVLRSMIEDVTDVVVTETASISKFLGIINSVSQLHLNIQKQIDQEISMTLPKELRQVRSESIQFSAKILNVAIQGQHLEELIVDFASNFEHPDNKTVEEILSMMKVIGREMSVNIDEHKRIAISFQKYLNIDVDDAKMSAEKMDVTKMVESIRRVTEEDVVVQADDFFFVDGNTVEAADESKPESIEEVNTKLAKNYFKPVLVQLKERIEVIGEDMKQREKKVLKAKGIEIEDEPAAAKLYDDCGDSGSDDECERERKFRRNEEKFSGNREFLEAKQPINLFATGVFPLPFKGPPMDEDVLE